MVGHHWQQVALGGVPPVAHHHVAVWAIATVDHWRDLSDCQHVHKRLPCGQGGKQTLI